MIDALKLWLHGFPRVGVTKDWAVRAESHGFAGVLLADSETLVADPYVELAIASTATRNLELGVAVTNPITRHPAVTAAAIASVHAECGGRGVLGIGRGDSALRQLHLQPASVSVFQQAIVDLRRFLGGDETYRGGARSTVAPLSWLPPGLSHVPVDVAATGPKVIATGAVYADRLTFNLGADVDRLKWAIAHARHARSDAGLDPSAMSLGAYVDVACAPVAAATAMVRGSASIFANLLAEGMRAGVPVSDQDASVLRAVGGAYDANQHGQSGAVQAQLLSDDFLTRFALCGTPAMILDRVLELRELGLDRLVIVPASRDIDDATTEASVAAFARGVLSRL